MSTTANPDGGAGALSQFTAVSAEVLQMTLTGKVGIDRVAKILYELTNTGGRFFIDVHTIAPITPAPLYRELSQEELQTLLATLQDQEQDPPDGLDEAELETFIHLLCQAVDNQPSTRFNNVRFGGIAKDASGARELQLRPIGPAQTLRSAAYRAAAPRA